jgi:hypothetical protein
MKKDSLAFRFTYTLALLATAAAVALTDVFDVYSVLVRYVPMDQLKQSFLANIYFILLKLAVFLMIALIGLLFTALFNFPTLTRRLRLKTLKSQLQKPRWAWLALGLAAALFFPILFVAFISNELYMAGLAFISVCMPFLWEYAMGLNKPEAGSVPSGLEKSTKVV